MESIEVQKLTDNELMNHLKHLAALWFKNSDILLLEELFRRFRKAQHAQPQQPSV